MIFLTGSDRIEDKVLAFRSGGADYITRAGCDAHLSKPISKPKLLETIEKYGRLNRQSSPAAEPISIRMPVGLEELVPSYLTSRREEIPELVKLLAAADFERLSSLAHNLKGSGLS